MQQDPVKALFARRDEEWKANVRRRHRFRPWRARRVIAEHDRLREMMAEMAEAKRERRRLVAAGVLDGSGERRAE
ncbi:hypothetical protein [Curtobacterium oceanosedimentum]|uniref:hypothetical protein n=1 Tax=Curtobacterium oceanosedimentum TaxID=465820 RepID=UPI001CE1D3CF|nr:hypothetical protein [Curtobacterium oceanosedimentum]MCA5924701.1 hypothetical protein [Curtobacterium oceanosedimentum]